MNTTAPPPIPLFTWRCRYGSCQDDRVEPALPSFSLSSCSSHTCYALPPHGPHDALAGMALAKTIVLDQPTKPDFTAVPSAVFSYPELATVVSLGIGHWLGRVSSHVSAGQQYVGAVLQYVSAGQQSAVLPYPELAAVVSHRCGTCIVGVRKGRQPRLGWATIRR